MDGYSIQDSSIIQLAKLDNWIEDTNLLTLSQKALVFECLQYKYFKNTGGKGEITHHAISPLPTVFSTCFGKLTVIFVKFEIIVCKHCQFGKV